MSIQHIRTPMTAAALALLLAACGGGGSDGGSNRAVSSSPTAPGASNTVNVNVDANSTAIAGSAAGSTTAQNGASGAPSQRPDGAPPGSEANSVGAGAASAGSNGNENSSNSASDASAATPPAAPAPVSPPAGGDAGVPTPTPAPTPAPAPTQPAPSTPPASGGDAGVATPAQPSPAPGADAGNAASPAAPTAVAPISAQGIRGDVFLAMLEQKPCGHDGLTPANGPNGSKGSEGLQNIHADTGMDNYKDDPNFNVVGMIHGFGCNGKIYEPVNLGDHFYTISNGVFAKFYTPPRPFNLLTAKLIINVNTESVRLGNELTASGSVTSTSPFTDFATKLTADSPYEVKRNELVPFGVLKQWSNGEQSEQLMLLQGGNVQEARLCWNTSLTHIKRLQCMIWGVPADWKAGGKLNPVNVTLEEDRSVYAGETGKAYWD